MSGYFRWKNKKLEKGQIGSQIVSKNSLAYVVLGLAVMAMTFFGVCTPNQGGGPSLGGAAATIAGQDVSYPEFRAAYQDAYQRYSRIYGEAFDPAAMVLSKRVLEGLVQQRVVYAQARNIGLLVPDKEVETQIIEAFRNEEGKFDAEQMDRVLKYRGYSEAMLYDEMRRNLTVNRYRQFIGQFAFVPSEFAKMEYRLKETKLDVEYLKMSPSTVKVSVTKDEISKFAATEEGKKEIKAFYDSNPSDFKKEKQVKASHILISFQGARRASASGEKRSKDEAQKLAEKVAAEAKANSKDFAKLAAKYTDEESGKTKGGDLGFFKKTDMVKEFSAVAWDMKTGDVSGVVESPFGFHVIKVTGVKDAVEKSLASASEGIAKQLLADKKKPEVLSRRSERILSELKKGNTSKNLIKDYGFAWKATGEFAGDVKTIPGLGAEQEMVDAVFTLKKKGEVFGKVLTFKDSLYILRLKQRKNPDMKSLDDKKLAELSQSSGYGFVSSLYTFINDKVEKQMKSSGDIWMNSKYVMFSSESAATGTNGG